MRIRTNGRRLCCLLLALCLLACFMPAALAEDETPGALYPDSDGLEMSVDNGSLSVSYSGTQSTALLIVAGYDNNGKMRTAETRVVAKGSVNSFSYDSRYIYQAFALNRSTYQPLCNSCGITMLPETDVEVPVIDGPVAESTAAAVNQLAEARLLLEELLTADFNGVAGNEQKYNALSAKLDDAIAAYDRLMTAGALLWNAANGAAAAGEAALASMGGQLRLQASEEDQLHWAQKLTEQFDSIKGNQKLASLGKMLGCDAREAYRQLTAAQDILRGKYMGDAETAERWVKGLTIVKTGAKVGMFVCGTIASGGIIVGGGTVAMGSVTAVQATGLMISGVDTAIDVTTTTATVVLGSDHKLVSIMEDKASPASNVSFLFSLCTLNSANAGEKLACFGDYIEKTRNIYNQLTELYNWRPDLNKLRAKARAGQFLSGPLKVKMAEDVPNQQNDGQIKAALSTAVTAIQETRGPVTAEKLQTIAEDAQAQGLIPEDKTLAKLRSDLETEIAADAVVPSSDILEYELPMNAEGPFTVKERDYTTSRYVESYNAANQKHGLWLDYSNGYLKRERYYIEDKLQWERVYFQNDDHLSYVYVYGYAAAAPDTMKILRYEEYYSPDDLPAGVSGQLREVYGYDLNGNNGGTEDYIYRVCYYQDGVLSTYSTGVWGTDRHEWCYNSDGYLTEENFDQNNKRYSYTYFSDKSSSFSLGHIRFYVIRDLQRISASNYLTLRREEWDVGGSAEFPYAHSVWVYNESAGTLEQTVYREPST